MLTPAQLAPTGLPADDDDPWADEAWDMGLPGEQAALEALIWNWGPAYDIGVDDGQWWFRRRDRAGGRETAATPDELHSMIVTDYSIYPPTPPALLSSPGQPPAPDSAHRTPMLTGPNHVLRAWREDRGLTRPQLADALSATEAARAHPFICRAKLIETWESGQTRWPRLHYRRALCELTGCDATQLGFTAPGQDTPINLTPRPPAVGITQLPSSSTPPATTDTHPTRTGNPPMSEQP